MVKDGTDPLVCVHNNENRHAINWASLKCKSANGTVSTPILCVGNFQATKTFKSPALAPRSELLRLIQVLAINLPIQISGNIVVDIGVRFKCKVQG